MSFARALKIVLSHEGGYVNHPNDKGGATNQGITQHSGERPKGLRPKQMRTSVTAITAHSCLEFGSKKNIKTLTS